MAAIKEYKCPCCGGAVEFDSKIQKIKCPYCDTEFDTEAFTAHEEEVQNAKPDEMDWETTAGGAWEQGEESTLRSYVCNSCGGEIVCDENTAATSGPYCGNPVVMMGQVSGAFKPDYVIPFKIDKKAAKEALQRHYKGKKLLPKIFKKENRPPARGQSQYHRCGLSSSSLFPCNRNRCRSRCAHASLYSEYPHRHRHQTAKTARKRP